MTSFDHDPLAKTEHLIHEMHDSTHRRLHPIYRRYPLLFLLVLTFSIAAVFDGVHEFLNQIVFFREFPLVLMALGVLGLFLTGSLYQRLGKEEHD